MFLQTYNQVTVIVDLVSTSPLIVKESRYGQDQKLAWSNGNELKKQGMPDVIPISQSTDMELKAAVSHGTPKEALKQLKYYLPGTSIRGAFRSHLERVLRGLEPEVPRVCDPFEESEFQDHHSCSDLLDHREGAFISYAASCPVCRMFGNNKLQSRITITDGVIQGKLPYNLVQREHIRIDRKSGKVNGPVLKFFGLDQTTFRMTLKLVNFELIHLKILGVLLGDLKSQNITLGFGKSKGYGVVKGEIHPLRLSYTGLDHPEGKLRGVASHANEATASWFQKRYGLGPETPVDLPGVTWKRGDMRLETEIPEKMFLEAVMPKIAFPWRSQPKLSERKLAGAL